MKNNESAREQRSMFSMTFMIMAVLFSVCLIASNLYASKIFSVMGITLPGAVIIFPISYILNDCLCEVYGYRKARLVIWIGFAMNLFIVLMSQLVVALPAASFWTGNEAFHLVFGATPKALVASMLGFLAGSTLNAWVMSKMKVASNGRRFSLRAVLSSSVGESADSLIFIPIMFWSIGLKAMLLMMLAQVVTKVVYEIVILPVTNVVVKWVKRREGIDTYDREISYNPFKILDI